MNILEIIPAMSFTDTVRSTRFTTSPSLWFKL